MSGVNFNITTNRAADASGAVPAGDRIAVPVVSTRAILSTDTTVSTVFVNVAGGGMAQIGSWQSTITTTVTSDIHIHINIPIYFTAASEAIIGYQINSETPVTVCYENWPYVNAHGRTVVVRDILKNRAPGTYTIKAMASRNVANFSVLGPTFNRNPTMVVEAFPTSAIADNWQSFTPTGSWNTNSTYTGWYRRVGQELQVRGQISLSGAPNAANLTVNLPAGFTINTSLLPSTVAGEFPLGQVTILDAATALNQGIVSYETTTSVRIYTGNASVTYVDSNQVSNTVPFTFGSGDKVMFHFSVPVT